MTEPDDDDDDDDDDRDFVQIPLLNVMIRP